MIDFFIIFSTALLVYVHFNVAKILYILENKEQEDE
jgi:hypothetical protein